MSLLQRLRGHNINIAQELSQYLSRSVFGIIFLYVSGKCFDSFGRGEREET